MAGLRAIPRRLLALVCDRLAKQLGECDFSNGVPLQIARAMSSTPPSSVSCARGLLDFALRRLPRVDVKTRPGTSFPARQALTSARGLGVAGGSILSWSCF